MGGRILCRLKIKVTNKMIYNTAIPVSIVRQNFRALEPNFKNKVNITICGEKWRIHRLGSRKKMKRKSETLSYFLFEAIERELGDTCFFSISSRTGGIRLVPSFYEGTSDCDTGELFLLLDGTGFFKYVFKNKNIQFEDADIEYELGMSYSFWEVADLIIKHYGKTTEIKEMMKIAAEISSDHSKEADPYGYLQINKIR
jgi:hypothetical protein